MAGGSSGGSSTTTTSSHLPAWAVPYAKELLGSGSSEYLPNGTVAQMPSNLNQQVAGFTPDQTAALNSISGTTGTANGLGTANAGYASGVLAGDQLNPNSNPYLAGTYNEAAQGLVNQYQTAIGPSTMAAGEVASGGGPGALGTNSSYNQTAALNQYNLGQNLNNLATNIYGGAYEQGIQNQLSVSQGIGNVQNSLYTGANEQLGAGSLEQQQQQSLFNTQYQNALNANQYPMQALSGFASLLGQATGGTGGSISVGTSPSGGGK